MRSILWSFLLCTALCSPALAQQPAQYGAPEQVNQLPPQAPPIQQGGQYYAPPAQPQYGGQVQYDPRMQQPYGVPPQQYAPPQQQYAPPQQGYVPPRQQYAPPQQGYVPPPQQYAPPQQNGATQQQYSGQYAPPAQPNAQPQTQQGQAAAGQTAQGTSQAPLQGEASKTNKESLLHKIGHGALKAAEAGAAVAVPLGGEYMMMKMMNNQGMMSPYGSSYGASPYGMSPYGMSPYGMSPYGMSPYGMSPYGTEYPYPGSSYPTTAAPTTGGGFLGSLGSMLGIP